MQPSHPSRRLQLWHAYDTWHVRARRRMSERMVVAGASPRICQTPAGVANKPATRAAIPTPSPGPDTSTPLRAWGLRGIPQRLQHPGPHVCSCGWPKVRRHFYYCKKAKCISSTIHWGSVPKECIHWLLGKPKGTQVLAEWLSTTKLFTEICAQAPGSQNEA